MKVYVSVPYKYMAKVDYEEVYNSICNRIRKKGDTPVLPDIEDNRVIGETKAIIANHLKRNIEKLISCDSMIFTNFHSCSHICNVEIAIAKQFSIDAQYVHRIKQHQIIKK